nr:protein ALP1-like [Ipomoea batatas]
MVDAIKNGWRDSSGGLSKLTVEKRILPALNEKLGCQRSSPEETNRSNVLDKLSNTLDSIAADIHCLVQRREKENGCWDAIKELPDLDSDTCFKRLLEAIAMLIHVLKEVIIDNNGEQIEHPLARRPITSHGYNYIQNVLTEDSDNFRQDCVGAIDGTHIPAMVTGRDFLAPYRGVRYHLQDFVGQGRDPENDVELFNLRHASLRNVIERIFGIFKSRFTIFKSAPPFPYKTQAELVLACAGLHNFLCKECRSDEFPIELDSDDSPSPLPMNDIDNFEQLFETQEQQREHANELRAKIALDMWRDTQQGETNANQR